MTQVQTLRSWLDERVSTSPHGERLPTYAAMARSFGVGVSTVRGVVGHYRARGRVHSVRGRGTFVGPAPETTPVDADLQTVSSKQSLVQAFAAAIEHGEFRRGDALPLVKQIALQFGVRPSTATGAYRSLARTGYVTQIGKRYWVGDLRTLTDLHAPREVYFFTHYPDDFEGLCRNTYVWRQVFWDLSYELSACGVALKLRHHDRFNDYLRRWRHDRRFPLGMVIAELDRLDVSHYVSAAKGMAGRGGRTGPSLVASISRKEVVRAARDRFAVLHQGNANTMMARAAAEWCARTRFSDIGYLCAHGHDLREAMRFMIELLHLQPGAPMRIAVDPERGVTTPTQAVDLMLKTGAPMAYFDGLLDKYGSATWDDVVSRLVFRSGLDRLLGDSPRRSLWIGQDHSLVTAINQWRLDSRRDTPEDMSLLALGMHPRYLNLDISSCSVDWRLLGYRIAHLLMGTLPMERTRQGFVRLNAHLTHRKTTRFEP